MPVCDGPGTGLLDEPCGSCSDANCVTELSACNPEDFTCPATGCFECITSDQGACTAENEPFAQAVITCLQTNCNAECFPPPPPPLIPACGMDVSTVANVPSGGACGMGVGSCNPVTNAPCDTAAGQACDVGQGGFQCYDPPNNNDLCAACGDQAGYCKAGMTCAGTGANNDVPKCVRFCCSNEDCGAMGSCNFESSYKPVGVCVEGGGGAGGAGGMGGAGGAGGMGGAGGAGGMGGAGGAGGMGGAGGAGGGGMGGAGGAGGGMAGMGGV